MQLLVFIARSFLTNFLRKSFSGNAARSATVFPLSLGNFFWALDYKSHAKDSYSNVEETL